VILVSYVLYPRTRFFTSFLAIESFFMVFLFIYLLSFLLKDGHRSSSGIVIVALILNTIINIRWYYFYKRRIEKSDQNYQLYKERYPRS